MARAVQPSNTMANVVAGGAIEANQMNAVPVLPVSKTVTLPDVIAAKENFGALFHFELNDEQLGSFAALTPIREAVTSSNTPPMYPSSAVNAASYLRHSKTLGADTAATNKGGAHPLLVVGGQLVQSDEPGEEMPDSASLSTTAICQCFARKLTACVLWSVASPMPEHVAQTFTGYRSSDACIGGNFYFCIQTVDKHKV